MSRICREVQGHLPDLVAATLGRWRRGLVTVHLRRCADCQAALAQQRAIAAGLDALGTASDVEEVDPPEGLLDTLLEQADAPGLRGRAAVPARGAVSGARPGLSVALLVIGAAAGTAAGYATWRSGRVVASRLSRRAGGKR